MLPQHSPGERFAMRVVKGREGGRCRSPVTLAGHVQDPKLPNNSRLGHQLPADSSGRRLSFLIGRS